MASAFAAALAAVTFAEKSPTRRSMASLTMTMRRAVSGLPWL